MKKDEKPKGKADFRKNKLIDKVVPPKAAKVQSVDESHLNENFENLNEPDLVDSPRSESPELGNEEVLSLIYNTQDAPAHFILESDWQRFGIIFASTFGFTWVFKIPLLCIKYGALSFFSFYALVLTFVAIPMAYIQLSLGQYSSLPPLQLFTRRTPLYKGLGVLLTVVRVAVIYVVFDDFMVQDLINSVFVLLRTHSNGETWADCRLPTNFLNCYDRLIICKDRYSNYNSSVFYQYLGECREVFIEGKLNPNYTYEQAVIIMTYGHAALRETPIETNLHQALDSYPNLIIVTSVLFSMMFMLFFGVHGVNKLGLVCLISAIVTVCALPLNAINKVANHGIDGIIQYGWFDFDAFTNPDFYVETFTAVVISTGVVDGTMILVGSFSKFNNNIKKDLVFVWISNITIFVLVFLAIVPTFYAFIKTKYPEDFIFTNLYSYRGIIRTTSDWDFHFQMLDMNGSDPVSTLVSALLSLGLAIMQICPQIMTCELIIQTVMNSSRHFVHVDIDTMVVFFYCSYITWAYIVAIMRDWTRGNGDVQGFTSVMVIQCIVPAIMLIQSICFIRPYSEGRLLTNIYTMRRSRKASILDKLMPFNRYYGFMWKHVLPVVCTIFFILAQGVLLNNHIISETSGVRNARLALYILTIVLLILIIPVFAMSDVRLAKQLGQNIGTLWEPSPRWGPLYHPDRRKAEFDERANRVRS